MLVIDEIGYLPLNRGQANIMRLGKVVFIATAKTSANAWSI